MRTGPLAAHGFLGEDPRSLAHIIQADGLILERLGLTGKDLAARMRFFTEQGRRYMGAQVMVDGNYMVQTEEHKGMILCPFAHNHQEQKDITALTNLSTGKTVRWSSLNIHFIDEHGFFEGRGAEFRLEPDEIAEILGLVPPGGN